MKYVELFAGCGGLSLGLESAGFDLVFANELSPMAAETFSYNLLNENLAELANNQGTAEHTLWINSHYRKDQLKARLAENPLTPPKNRNGYSDLGNTATSLQRKLLVGSVIELNKILTSRRNLTRELRAMDIDLVSGGPPCQSFSLAGLRQHNNSRNTLPLEFANFVGLTRPKLAVLENVSGILRAFKLPNGSKLYAWFEVARAFGAIEYFPLCLHVNAKNVGAAQNRPRFIMIAIRKDLLKNIQQSNITAELKAALDRSVEFTRKELTYRKGKGPPPVAEEDLGYFDLIRNPEIFNDTILKPLNSHCDNTNWNTAKDAIGDLLQAEYSAGEYSNYIDLKLKKPRGRPRPTSFETLWNHKLRANGSRVKRRFRLYQMLSRSSKSTAKDVFLFLGNPDAHEMKRETIDYLLTKKYLSDKDGTRISFKRKPALLSYLKLLATKKRTQRALLPNEPAPATLSIPDDACHYNPREIRTLSVRELARFQSFPDWFVFRSKETTGGQMRKYQVPQYTQVGNAVPPLLGLAIGKVVANLLKT